MNYTRRAAFNFPGKMFSKSIPSIPLIPIAIAALLLSFAFAPTEASAGTSISECRLDLTKEDPIECAQPITDPATSDEVVSRYMANGYMELLKFLESVGIDPSVRAQIEEYVDLSDIILIKLESSDEDGLLIVMINRAESPVPVISISPDLATIVEGRNARFTLTAEPAPDAELEVSVRISQMGDVLADGQSYAEAVTIGMNGKGSLSVATDDDEVDEANGTITADLADGDGYDVSPSEGSASVTVSDNDEAQIRAVIGYQLCAYDTANIDGDRVDIYVNTVRVFVNLTLPSQNDEECTQIELKRHPERNTIRVHAIDEGGEPTNTAALLIRHATSGASVSPLGAWRLTAGQQQEWNVYAISENEVRLEPIDQTPKPPQKQAVEGTVAAVAAAAVSNVSSNIGARFSAPSGGTSVSLAGTPVAFGSAARSQSAWTFANRVDPFDEDSSQSWQRTMNGSELLRSSSFEIALGAAEGNKGDAADVGRQFTIWGRGDFQVFESGGGRKSGYDGDMVAGYLGADFTTDGRWLLGMAVSRIAAEADYTLGSAGGGGTIDAELTNLHPYLRVALDDRSEAWAILGFGKGEVTDKPRSAAAGKSDLSMRMVSAGARHRLNTGLGIDLALLGDGSFAEISTDEGVEAVDGISANVWRARAGVEASYTSVWEGGSSLTSFMEVAARKDGGDSTEGVGLELSPGLAFSNPESGFSMEARARALALHSADNHKEYGASITASLTPGSDGLGLSMVVAPTWGTPDSSLDSFETSMFSREGSADRGADSLSLNSRVSYGFAAGRGVLAPFAELALDDSDRRRIRIGSRYSLGSSAVMELFGDRMGDGAGSNEHSVQIRARIGF